MFAGDVLFQQNTPMGWTGTYEKWYQRLELILQLKPNVIVPGHGPICGLEGITELKAYLEYIRAESKNHFDAGRTLLETSKRTDLSPYA